VTGEDEEEVSRYRITWRKRVDARNWKRKH
jgi:hypothetical protein